MLSKQTLIYKIVGDCEIRADVYRPLGDSPCPAILWLHGGALILGDRGIHPDQLAIYLQAGYAVISVDYRLAPEVKLELIIEDLRDAHEWVRAMGDDSLRIDPERIAVIGHSAGGYLTLMAGFCVTPRPRALVSFYGYGDIAGHWYSRPAPFYSQQPPVSEEEAYQAIGGPVLTGTASAEGRAEERGRFYLYCRQWGLWPKEVTGHDPDKESEWFDPFCPVRNVTAEYPPTLLIHGDQDTDVPFEQSVLMSEELERHGVEHQLIALTGRGHAFDTHGEGMKDPDVSEVFDQVLAFLERHGIQ
jgi:acetyl esterase/lipase